MQRKFRLNAFRKKIPKNSRIRQVLQLANKIGNQHFIESECEKQSLVHKLVGTIQYSK